MTFDRARRTVVPPELPTVGDRVLIVAGKNAGSRGELVDIAKVPTPSGGIAVLAVVRRPRAGDTFAFVGDVRRVE